MSPTNYRDDIIPQDTADDDSTLESSTDLPLTEDEIEDLLYGEGRSTAERLALLRVLRSDLASRSEGDDADDPAALMTEIDGRIAELEGESDGDSEIVLDSDPLAHRETLAPDSDELEELEEEDEESLEEDEEDEGWEEGEDGEFADEETAEDEDLTDDDEDDEDDVDNGDEVAR